MGDLRMRVPVEELEDVRKWAQATWRAARAEREMFRTMLLDAAGNGLSTREASLMLEIERFVVSARALELRFVDEINTEEALING